MSQMEGYHRREAAWRKRLVRLAAPAVLINLALLVTIDVLHVYPDEPIDLGREGPLEILPELTIIPDDQERETFLRIHRASSLEATDVDYFDDQSKLPDNLRRKRRSPRDSEFLSDQEENPPVPEVHPMHKSVPRSESYKILYMVEPEYPPGKLQAHEEGEVTLEVYVNELGRVEYAAVMESEGGPEFEVAALDAIYQFLFEAPVIDGRAQSFWHVFVVRFEETTRGGKTSTIRPTQGDEPPPPR